MPKDIHQRDTAQQRSSRLLLAMGIIVLLGALAYFVLTLVVNRRTPASPDTRYTAENGISVYYESAVWPVCEMTEDATLGRALELASAQSSDDANYQVVLFQKGTKDTYEDFIGQSEKELKQAYHSKTQDIYTFIHRATFIHKFICDFLYLHIDS